MKTLQAQCTLARRLATSLRLPVIPNLPFGPPHTFPGQHAVTGCCRHCGYCLAGCWISHPAGRKLSGPLEEKEEPRPLTLCPEGRSL